MKRLVLWVLVGSAAGGLARFFVGGLFSRGAGVFPWGTLLVNITGCFLIGGLHSWAGGRLSPEARGLLMAGFCGAYTTFSTFVLEISELMQRGRFRAAVGYVGASLLLGLLFFAWGTRLAQHIRFPSFLSFRSPPNGTAL